MFRRLRDSAGCQGECTCVSSHGVGVTVVIMCNKQYVIYVVPSNECKGGCESVRLGVNHCAVSVGDCRCIGLDLVSLFLCKVFVI